MPIQSSEGDHDPEAFSAEVARRVRSAVVSQVPQRRALRVLLVFVVLGILLSGMVVLLGR